MWDTAQLSPSCQPFLSGGPGYFSGPSRKPFGNRAEEHVRNGPPGLSWRPERELLHPAQGEGLGGRGCLGQMPPKAHTHDSPWWGLSGAKRRGPPQEGCQPSSCVWALKSLPPGRKLSEPPRWPWLGEESRGCWCQGWETSGSDGRKGHRPAQHHGEESPRHPNTHPALSPGIGGREAREEWGRTGAPDTPQRKGHVTSEDSLMTVPSTQKGLDS